MMTLEYGLWLLAGLAGYFALGTAIADWILRRRK